jgi:NAD(P)-dependent dehydrogenase (short-subunit alcohol dehydrogenase family)
MVEKDLFQKMTQRYFGIEGKTALVTGGTKGFGRAIAETLSIAGAKVSLCSRNAEESLQVAQEISLKTGNVCFGAGCDVSKKAEVLSYISKTEKSIGPVDILIASAGINIRKDSPDLTEEDWDAVMDVNVKGTFFITQALISGMRSRRWGRMVLFGSMLSHISMAQRAVYASSKAAILGLMRTLALESAADGVCVNAVCPGPFKTPLNAPVLADTVKAAEFAKAIPIGRWADPDELCALVLYLSSPASSYMTGSSLIIDGGWTAQ